MRKTRNILILFSILFVASIVALGTTYALFNYTRTGSENQLVVGRVYLHYTNNSNALSLVGVEPRSNLDSSKYVEFTIDGLNEHKSKDLWYAIDVLHGDVPNGKTEQNRIRDDFLRFTLTKQVDNNSEEVVIDNAAYSDISDLRLWVLKIPKETNNELSHKYKLYFWISDVISVGNTSSDYTLSEWSNLFASIKIRVIGDYAEKEADEPLFIGSVRVLNSIEEKKNNNVCNPSFVDNMSTPTDNSDDIVYFSGTNECVNNNYVWYSGKMWRITAIYPDGAMKLVTNNNMTSISFHQYGQFYFYNNNSLKSYAYQWLNEDFYSTLYQPEKIIDTTKQWNQTNSNSSSYENRLSNTSMVNSNVGLLNSYEYYNSFRCINSVNCSGTNYDTGYLKNNYLWWLINPYSNDDIWVINTNGSVSHLASFYSFGIRPSIYIKPNILFSGEGTILSPYKIASDKASANQNDLINTRLGGEYVKLKNGNNEQLFRIISVDDNKTKIVSVLYADNNSQKPFATTSSDVIWGSGTTTDTGTWYTYLNNTYYPNLVSTYYDLFDNGMYYLGKSDYNYKMAICANMTSGDTKVCDKTTSKALFDVGLLRYGEFLSTQHTNVEYTSKNMWLINPFNNTHIWYSGYGGNSGVTNDATSTYVARPTLYLRSNVKVLSGDGTEYNPYIVGYPETELTTISFNANDGEVSMANKNISKTSTTYGYLPTPTRSGYTFDGWYTSSSGGTIVTSSTTYTDGTSVTTLYAHWS